jgi:hypothetical protein
MLRRLRLIVTAGAFAVCLIVLLATAVTVFRQGVSASPPEEFLAPPAIVAAPGPAAAPTSDQELRMLVSQDLTRAPREYQLAVATQLEQLLRTRHDWRPPLDQEPTPEQLRRLQENLAALLRVWFLAKADQYAALRPAQRGAFLDDLLAPIDALEAMARSAGRQTTLGAKARPPIKLDGQAKAAGAPIFMNLLAKLQEGTTAEEQNKAAGLFIALAERRQLRAKQSGKQPRPTPP